jgi:Ca2+-binding EF-hand superfamily protein
MTLKSINSKINSMSLSQEIGDNDFLASPEMDVAKKAKEHPSINDYYKAMASGDKPIKYQHGLSNYSNVQFGDDRVVFNKSMSQVMYQLNEEQANQMTIHSQIKTKKQRMQDYQEANGVVGPEKIQEMEQMMRDKLQQRTKAGPFQLRKTFKYFDRDGSGGIDFSEFQRAMELMGFQFTDMQQLALFARYDESYSGEVDYHEFVQKVMESDFKGVSNASKKALNTLVSSTFLNEDGGGGASALEGDDDSDFDENELETFRRAEVRKLFGMVDGDGSGLIDKFEFRQLLEDLGRNLPPDYIDECFARLDTDSSGHIDFEEFFAWAYPKK